MPEVHEQTSCNLTPNYGEDKIILLARDPDWLYAYWEITKEKINTFIDEFGSQIWEKSIPVLKITNITKNESFYIRINDFSDSWYIKVPEPNTLYAVEIGRKISDKFFIGFAVSNHVLTPGNNMSLNTNACFVNINKLPEEINEQEIMASKNNADKNRYFMKINGDAGLSSAQLYERNLLEYLGTSSESFLKG